MKKNNKMKGRPKSNDFDKRVFFMLTWNELASLEN
jgi:hypothetical protein